ncbi:MAG: hypothetical protein WBL42_04025 [Methanoregula sp.]
MMIDSTKAQIELLEKMSDIQIKELEKSKLSPKDAEETKSDFEKVVMQILLSPIDDEGKARIERVRRKFYIAVEKATKRKIGF